MRVENVEKRLGEQREIVVQPLVHARGEEREGFDQSLDVRVFTDIAAELQSTGDFWIALGEIARVRTQEGKFALVVRKQFVHAP